jgi:hypothetical protein
MRSSGKLFAKRETFPPNESDLVGPLTILRTLARALGLPTILCDYNPGTHSLWHRCQDEIAREGDTDETYRAHYRGYGCSCGMYNNAKDPNLPRRFRDRDGRALSAASAAAAAAAATDGDLSGRIDRPAGNDLSDSAASTTASAPSAEVRRTRLIFEGPARERRPPLCVASSDAAHIRLYPAVMRVRGCQALKPIQSTPPAAYRRISGQGRIWWRGRR